MGYFLRGQVFGQISPIRAKRAIPATFSRAAPDSRLYLTFGQTAFGGFGKPEINQNPEKMGKKMRHARNPRWGWRPGGFIDADGDK